MIRYGSARTAARAFLATATVAAAVLLPAAAAHAQQPAAHHPRHTGHGRHRAASPWIVSLGDSYISGEAGRWAGNTNLDPALTDALGPTAYDDNPNGGELIPRCHRSKSAEIHIGGGVQSLNLACSGAETRTGFSDGYFKPGLDFYNENGRQGQALMLEEFAKTHHVTMIAVSIGGNDFGFGSIVQSCLTDYYFKSNPTRDYYCKDDPSVTKLVAPPHVDIVTDRIIDALRNIDRAMALAGYSENSYRILLQNYPAPLPYGKAIRYPENYDRQNVGGCGLWNADIDWALTNALPRISAAVFNAAARSGLHNIAEMDLSSAFDNRRLCQNTVGLLEAKGLKSWTDRRAVDETEWIDQIRIFTVGTPYYQQESLHPNYWGQLALRNCVRQAYDNGAVRGGKCIMSGTGRDARGEPNMHLNTGTSRRA